MDSFHHIPKGLRTHTLRLLGPRTILCRALGLFLSLRVWHGFMVAAVLWWLVARETALGMRGASGEKRLEQDQPIYKLPSRSGNEEGSLKSRQRIQHNWHVGAKSVGQGQGLQSVSMRSHRGCGKLSSKFML